ncbi:hypothetical protein B9D92_21870, partial [Mycobacterium tuberculosis]
MYATFYSVEYPLVDADEAMDPAGMDGKADRLVERENLANRGADHMYATFYSVEYPLVDADEAMDPAGMD